MLVQPSGARMLVRRPRLLVAVCVAAALTLAGAGTAGAVSTPSVGTVHIKGQVTNATTGYGVAGMCVHLGRDGTSHEQTVTTTSDGHYQADFAQIPGTTATYVIDADAGCGANWWWSRTYPDSNPKVTALPGKATAARVNMTTHHGGRIAGRITNQAGQPIANALAETSGASSSDGFADMYTKSDGTFILGGIPSGDYQVRVESQDNNYLTPSFVPHVFSDVNANWYTVTEGTTTFVNDYLLHSDAITGTVTDAQTGTPISGVAVSVVLPDSYRSLCCAGTTGADGSYEVWGLAPGSYVVCFIDEDNVPSTHQNACYKDQPYTEYANQGTLVSVSGYGTKTTGIDQTLALK